MYIPIIFIGIIMLMRVLQSLFNKKAALALPDGIKPYLSYITLSKFLAALFALVLIIPTMDFSGVNAEAIIIASCSGICLAIGSVCGIKALLGGTIALSSIFSTAGMIIPIILGTIFFNEPVGWIQWFCIVVLFASMCLLMNATKSTFKGFSFKTLGWLMGNFLSNGMVMFCQAYFKRTQPEGNVAMFSMFTFLIPAIVLAVILLVMQLTGVEKEKSIKLPKNLVIYSLVLAFAVFVIQQLVTMIGDLPPALLFTFVNGGGTIIAAIVGALVYKEKITLKSGIGLALALGSLICIKVFETDELLFRLLDSLGI